MGNSDYKFEERISIINDLSKDTTHSNIPLLANETLNKPLAVALILAFLASMGFVIKYYFFSAPPKDSYTASSQNQTGGITANNVNFYQSTTSQSADAQTNTLLPHNIIGSLENLALPQRQAVANSYEDQIVNWNIYTYFHGKDYFVGTVDKGDGSLIINCDVGEDVYPELRVSNEEDVFAVKANIESVETGKINLKNCELTAKHTPQ